MNKRQQLFNKELISNLLKTKNSYVEILVELELPRSGGNCFTTLKENIKKWNLDISDFEERQKIRRKEILKKANKSKEVSLDEILVYNSKRNLGGNTLKKKLYKAGLKKRECEDCGQGEEWRGKKMSLILDHVNGDRVDDRIENLRILCPNCNATLDTHCGKNRKKVGNNFIINKKKLEHQQKEEQYLKDKQEKIYKILNSNIDFLKFGWRKEVAKLLNYTPQYAGTWVKNHMSVFYEEKCWKYMPK